MFVWVQHHFRWCSDDTFHYSLGSVIVVVLFPSHCLCPANAPNTQRCHFFMQLKRPRESADISPGAPESGPTWHPVGSKSRLPDQRAANQAMLTTLILPLRKSHARRAGIPSYPLHLTIFLPTVLARRSTLTFAPLWGCSSRICVCMHVYTFAFSTTVVIHRGNGCGQWANLGRWATF